MVKFRGNCSCETRIRHYLKQRCEEDAVKLGEVELNAALQPHNLGDFSIQQIRTVLECFSAFFFR